MMHAAQRKHKGVLGHCHTHIISWITCHLPQHQQVQADCEGVKEAGHCAAGCDQLDLGTKLKCCRKRAGRDTGRDANRGEACCACAIADASVGCTVLLLLKGLPDAQPQTILCVAV